jgi:hypothetical protein
MRGKIWKTLLPKESSHFPDILTRANYLRVYLDLMETFEIFPERCPACFIPHLGVDFTPGALWLSPGAPG